MVNARCLLDHLRLHQDAGFLKPRHLFISAAVLYLQAASPARRMSYRKNRDKPRFMPPVKDRVKPARGIGFKASHFEEPTVCCKEFSKSMTLRFREVRHGKPTQNGCGVLSNDFWLHPGCQYTSAAAQSSRRIAAIWGRSCPITVLKVGTSGTRLPSHWLHVLST